jgi:hypothetical protein
MNAEIKQLWCDALRSGEYAQNCYALRSIYDEFCCFGVLCDLYQKTHSNASWNNNNLRGQWFFDDGTELCVAATTDLVNEWAGLDCNIPIVSYRDVEDNLTTLNDRGISFAEIAQIIEEQL